jgi:exopolysaccharide production protein ExoZ
MSAFSKPLYLSSLQVFRGLAALGVVIYHACLFTERKTQHVLLGGWYHFGELGVDFFFVLSGFIIMLMHGDELGRPECSRRYIYRRFFRVYPLLFILTTLKLGMELVMSRKGGTAPDISRILSSYLLLPDPGGQLPVITAAWTLMHEALFYLLFLLAILLGRRLALILLAVWMTAIFTNSILGTELQGIMRLISDAHNVEFVFGIVACVLFQMRHRLRARLLWISVTAIALLFIGASLYNPLNGMDQQLTVRLFLGASFGMIIFLAGIWEQGFQASPWPRWACWLGDASYSIYLGHSLVVLGIVQAGSRLWPESIWARFAVAAVSCLVALVVCGLIWRLVEKPMLRWSRHRFE